MPSAALLAWCPPIAVLIEEGITQLPLEELLILDGSDQTLNWLMYRKKLIMKCLALNWVFIISPLPQHTKTARGGELL